MKTRLNRSLSSVKSLAPCFTALRVRHTSAYDFTCRHCGEVLQPEKELFILLDLLVKTHDASTGVADASGTGVNQTDSVKEMLAELETLHSA